MAEKTRSPFVKRLVNGIVTGTVLSPILYVIGSLFTAPMGEEYALVPAIMAAIGFTAPIAVEVNKGIE